MGDTMLLLCIKIFLVRIVDVSLGTFRTIITVRGRNLAASVVGFFEVLVWFLIAKEALSSVETSLWVAIAYSLGFAAGTYIGGYISSNYIKGTLSVQVIVNKSNTKLIEELRKKGFAVSVMDVEGHDKKKEKVMLFLEIDNRKLRMIKNIIKNQDEKAFVVVNETKYVQNGYFK